MEIENTSTIVRTSEMKINHNPGTGTRLLYIDNLRWLMIIFVVLIHLNCTYGNIGRWYYLEQSPSDVFSQSFFGMFGSLTQAYFMGFLFFIAGYFVPGSYDKKGCGRFLWDQLIRLGIPALIYMVFLHPITIIIIAAFNHQIPADWFSVYQKYLTSIELIYGSGPLWFALALLIFSIFYGLGRFVFSNSKERNNQKPMTINHSRMAIIASLISLSTFLVRLVQPIGTAVFNMQLCYFSQYIILFSLGIIAYRHDLLINLPFKLGMFWFKLALWIGIPGWGLLMLFGGALTNWTPFAGGLYWQAAGYAIWESFFCVGVCLGLLVLFRDKYNIQGRLSWFLSENAFGVYVFHTPLMVGITMLVRGIVIYPVLKMLLASMIVLPVCFGFSYLIRKIPLLKKIFA